MPKPDPNAELKIEAYIDDAPRFAQPILTVLRDLVHEAHPEIQDDWKWRIPAYTLNGIVCVTGGFKKHVSLTFCYGSAIDDWAKVFEKRDIAINRTIRYANVKQVKADVVLDYMAQAAAINLEGRKPRLDPPKPKPLVVPNFVQEGVYAEGPQVQAFFEAQPLGMKRQYCSWIMSAKQEETRIRRREKMLAAMRIGKKFVY